MWERAKQILLGVATDPQLVAAARGLLVIATPIGVGIALAWVQGWTDPLLLPLIPAAAFVLRALEGALDRAYKGAGINDIPPSTAPPTP